MTSHTSRRLTQRNIFLARHITSVMGNRSSRYVKKSEYAVQVERMRKMLDDIQREHDRLYDDVKQANKRVKTEIKSITELSENQVRLA